MRTLVPFVNPRTGEQRNVKVGWSWTLFWFSGFFGFPFFYRKVWNWGFAYAAFWFAYQVAIYLVQNVFITLAMSLVSIGLAIFAGLKGNEITAKQHLDEGWHFAYPEANATRYAKIQWHLAPPQQYENFSERRDPSF